MAQFEEDPFVETDSSSQNNGSYNKPFPMESDSAFTMTSLDAPSKAATGEESPVKTNTTFIQNQISIQRSPSTVKDHASALSRTLSAKSNGSYDTSQPALATVLTSTPETKQREVYQEARGRDLREGGDSDASIVDVANKCTLSKSSSERSTKSVRSMQAIGTHSFGTLRVHSPSPTRAPNIKGLEFLKSGDVVVVRDIPVGVVFGYDTISFTIKQQGVFEGIKNLNPGAHFIWAGTSDGSLRTGFWLMSSKLTSDEYGEVIVKRWDKYNEVLVDEVSVAEIRIQENSLPEIADKLQPYTVKHDGINDPTIWTRLTSSMKAALLNKVTGQMEWNHWQVSSNHDYKISNGASGGNNREFGKDEILDFVFPKDGRTFSANSVGRERTEQAMDTSAHILAIISGSCTHEDSDEIIGELQFCYLTGMMLGNIACMEHWAHIVKVMFRAFRLVMDLPILFRKFIQAVHAQFVYDGVGFEGSILDADGGLEHDLKNLLTVFKSRLDEQLLQAETRLTPEQKSVGDAFAQFESFLWKWRGGWDLRGNYVRSGQIQLEDGEFVDAEIPDFEAEDERGEFAPAVVQLDDDGREIGLVRF
ncbi:AAR2 protein-domain-containing protein [Rhexocercosporidium sp. MPI-PUGE-AT-0058]|nr:AAR2 protein-domain-containing protein [Rhexocercosporidium sp. MPI-PUGE-AT-0058]